MIRIFVDADAFPVKQETSRVAGRHGIEVILVSNARMRIPHEPHVSLVVVAGQFDSADDWIVEYVARYDLVVSADILLASRCLKKGVLCQNSAERNLRAGMAFSIRVQAVVGRPWHPNPVTSTA